MDADKVVLIGPSIIVADEAHYLKASNAQITQLTREFTSTSRIAMTGSPLSNNLEEYWSMIEWIDPGFLGPQKEFTQKYVGPISDGLWADSSYEERRLSLKMLKVLKNEISVKINRAGIDAIKDVMPPKTEFMITVPLTSVQDAMYRRLVLLPSTGYLSVSLRNKVYRNYDTVLGTGLYYGPRLCPVAVAHLQSSGNLC